MARAIIRWSVSHEGDNKTGNHVAGRLRDSGFERIGTASYECEDGDRQDLIEAIRDVLGILHDLPGGGTLDHVWTYIDSPPDN